VWRRTRASSKLGFINGELRHAMAVSHIAGLVEGVQRVAQAADLVRADDPGLQQVMTSLEQALDLIGRDGSSADLDAAAAALQHAASVTSDVLLKATFQELLGTLLVHKPGKRAELTDPDAATSASQQAAGTVPEAAPIRGVYARRLAEARALKSAPTRLPPTVENDESPEPATQNIKPTSSGGRHKGLLGSVHAQLRVQSALDHFQRTGSLADLDRVIEVIQQALADTSPDDGNRAAFLSDLSAMLRERFERTGQLPDVDHAIEAGEQAMAAAIGDTNRVGILSNLASALMKRFAATGEIVDLDRAVDLGEQALAAVPPESRDRAKVLSNLCAILKTKFVRAGGTVAGLDRAAEIGEQALAATPPGDPNRPLILSNVGIVLRARFERTGQLADLDRAIEVGDEAVKTVPPAYPGRAMFLNNLGFALADRFVRIGAAADADRAIQVIEQAIACASANQADNATFLSNLSSVLWARFERTGAQADLDRAIEVGEQGLAATAPGHPDRGRTLVILAGALQDNYKRTGRRADLDRAIEIGEQALAATSSDHPDLPVMLSSLGVTRRRRFERTGAQADLDRAIDFGEQAVAAFSSDDPRRAGCLANLGGALSDRFERTGALADLDRAIEITNQALAATSLDHPGRAGILSNLGICLGARFDRTGALADLGRAVDLDERALAATPPDQPEDYPRRLSNLGADLFSRFQRTGAAADLDRAIEVGEQSVAVTQPGNVELSAYLANLGIARRARYRRTGVAADLDRAVEVQEQSVAATTPGDPDRTGHLCNLGTALWSRFERTGAAADRKRVIAVGREGAAIETAAPSDRARAARMWADFAAGIENWDAAVEGYGEATALLEKVAPRSLGRSDQEYWLGEAAGLAERAAACCLQARQPEKAVELWEQGRGVLLGQAMDLRTDLTRLARSSPGLAAQFSQLRDELNNVPISPGRSAGTTPAVARGGLDRRRQINDQLDHVVEEIRSNPGFDRFLMRSPIAELLPDGDSQSVVLVNLSDIRSDALVLVSSGVQVVPLPGLTPQAARQQVETFQSALEELDDLAAGEERRRRAEHRLSDVLGWLWDVVTSPVLERLGITGPPAAGEDGPRLWWCPSGLLAFLPLHAAGHLDTLFDAAPQTVLDRVVSSYTPTVRALAYSRQDRPADVGQTSSRRLLVVAMPHTPHHSDLWDLPGAADEIALLNKLFPGQTTILAESQATHENVAKALAGCQWAHFACHATSELSDPSASHLVLYDDRLTVLDLARVRLGEADLAFLSACATARTGARLADEAIQLASAFQLAGYRHVIASLWSIGDRPAVRIATDVYSALAAKDAASAAVALHKATRRLRGFTARQPSAWAAHIHCGA
jgi:tetratricopeptide (TPR) repeat protein